ncbi:MAG: hypothetical protein E7042_08285 [Lentisphaerae bacterium]|nr:hypothetical protein [Lentisphaerota bacterium]
MFCLHCNFEFPADGNMVGAEVACPNCSLPVQISERQVQCICPECEGRVAVPLYMTGGSGKCPHCLKEIHFVLGSEADKFFPEIARRAKKFSDSTLSPGDMVGKYRVIRCLGIGGMGEVYLVEHVLLNSQFALKILRKEVISADPDLQSRLLREARLAGNIHHPNLIAVVDVELDSNTSYAYIVMEYVNGVSIEQLLEVGAISELRTLEIVRDAGLALKAAAEHHIVHRDIKPANIMLSSDGVVKVTDLGVAKVSGKNSGAALTLDNAILGTPNYASPEQLRSSNKVDCRADIYSLGVTMYHMLTGIRPFDADSVYGVMANVLDRPLEPVEKVNPKISRRVSALINKMSAKNLEQRPENIDVMLEMIEQEIAVLKRPAWKKFLPFIAATAAALIILIIVLAAVFSGSSETEAKTVADKPAEAVKVETPAAVKKTKPINVSGPKPIRDVERSAAAIPEKATLQAFKTAKKQNWPEINLEELITQLRESDGSVRIEMRRVPEMLNTLSAADRERLNVSAMHYFDLRCRNLLGAEKYLALHRLFQNCAWINDSRFFELRDSLPGHLLEVFLRAVGQDNYRLALDTGRLYLSLAPEAASSGMIKQYVAFEDFYTRCNFGACRELVNAMPEDESVTAKLRERIENIAKFEETRLKREIYAAFDKEDFSAIKELLDEFDAVLPGSSFVSYFRRRIERRRIKEVKMNRKRVQGIFNDALASGNIRLIRFGMSNGADIHRMVMDMNDDKKVTLLMRTLQKCKTLQPGYARQRMVGGILAMLEYDPELFNSEYEVLGSIPEFKDYL